MSTFIKRYKAKNGGTVIQVVYKEGRRVVKTVHIGTAHTDEKLNLLIALAKEEIRGDQLGLDLFALPGEDRAFVMERSYPKLLVDTLTGIYDSLGFGAIDDEVFKQLVIARLIEPTSKLDTIRVLNEVGIEPPSNSEIHRSLRRAAGGDYRSVLSQCCLEHASASSLTLLLYDVTTLYFEIQKEDEYRKPGMSKERRLEPQITVGLLVGRDGFPLEVQSFEGNRAEVKTIMEVLTSFKDRYGLANLTVTADAAMLSSANIQSLEEAGFHYIIGSRLAKTPYEIAQYAKEDGAELQDGQIFDLSVPMNTGKGDKRIPRRVVYQYKKKRAELDLRNINKLLDKAVRMVEGKTEFKRNRFLTVKGAEREINYELVASSRLRAGIKGYVTDLDISPAEVINAYHQLFEVERSFRMAKTDLKARPIFHYKRDSIEAHLTIVFAALAIARKIQQRTKISIRRFIQTLRPIQTGVVLVNGKRMVAEPYLNNETRELLRLLEG